MKPATVDAPANVGDGEEGVACSVSKSESIPEDLRGVTRYSDAPTLLRACSCQATCDLVLPPEGIDVSEKPF